MSFSINIDWTEELSIPDKWENLGRQALEEHCDHKTRDDNEDVEDRDTNMRYSGSCEECGVCEDTAEPMMNFCYPLETTPSEEKALEVVQRTNCTIMHNTETDEYFLVLCGGGMDLSQDIALAYHIVEKWIPYELCANVCTQKCLSVSKTDWPILQKAMQESLSLYKGRAEDLLHRWTGAMSE